MFAFRALGGVSIRADCEVLSGAVAQKRQLALLALLAVPGTRGTSREKLTGYLWPEKSDKRARGSLSQSLYVLRSALADNVVLEAGNELRLNFDLLETDVSQFEIAYEGGNWQAAVAVYGGSFLDGFYLDDAPEFERWVQAERDRLARKYQSALEELAEEAAARGEAVHAAEWWRRIVSLDPESARVVLRLMQALDAAGDRAGAIGHARVYSALVREEYGAEPDPTVVDLAERLRAEPRRPGLSPEALAGGAADQNERSQRVPSELTVRLPSAPGPVPARPSRSPVSGKRSVLIAGLLILLSGVIWGSTRGDNPSGEPFRDGARVAVFPFIVRGASDLDYLGPGLTTLLSASLDGVGQLSAVDPHLLLGHLRRNAVVAFDPASAETVARQLQATSYVIGEVVGVGNRLRIHARWYDLDRRPERIAEAEVEGASDDVFALTDRLAAELWTEQTALSGDLVFSSAARTTSSLPALKEYTKGEGYLSAGNYPAAVINLQLALVRDSTFGYAAYRLGTVAEWVGNWPLASEARERAMRFSSRLPPRERFLTEALSAAREHDPARALRMYRDFLDQNPNDAEALFWFAQTQYRLGSLIGLPPQGARAMFERVLLLNPKHLPALMHLMQHAAWEGDEAALDSLLVPLLAAYPDYPLPWSHLALIAVGNADPEARLGISYGALGDSLLWRLAQDAALYTQNIAGTKRIARHLTDSDRAAELRVAGHLLLSFLEMSQGRARAAQRHLTAVAPLDSAAYLQYRALFATPYFLPIPAVEVRAIRDTVAAWKGKGRENPYLPLWSDMYPPVAEFLLGVLSARIGDSDAAQRHIVALEQMEGSPHGLRLNAMRANAVRARLAAERGESASAFALLAQTDFPTSAVSHPHINHDERNLRAGLLRALGREQEALDWFDALPWRGSYYREQTLWDLIHLAPFQFERAELLEELGRDADAAEHYDRFVMLWSDADSELQPKVEEARRQIARLRRGQQD